MSVRKFVRGSAAVVSVSTFVLLYFGLVDLSRMAGVSGPLSWLYPLAIDGMVAAAYAATLTMSGHALRFAWSVVGIGSALSLAGQWLHASHVSTWVFAGPVAAAPALSMALVWHLLYLVLKDGQDKPAETPEPVSEAVPAPAPVAVPVRVVRPAVALPAAVPAAVVSVPVKARQVSPVRPETLAKAVAILSAAEASGERMTGALMASRLGLANAGTASGNKTGQRWVIRAKAALN